MTSATATQVKKKTQKIGGRRINAQMIPTIAAVVIFILMIIMGQALFGTYLRLGFVSSLFIDHAYLIILAVAMTLPVLTGGIDLSVGAIVAITDRHADRGIQHAAVHRLSGIDVPGAWHRIHHLHQGADLPREQQLRFHSAEDHHHRQSEDLP